MDIRERIIQTITERLQTKVPENVLDLVQDILTMELNQYEIQERCTELDVPDTSAEGQLKRYIATKRLEGKAPSTLRRYFEENMRMLRFFRKPLRDITTYDLRFYLSLRRRRGKKRKPDAGWDAQMLQQLFCLAGIRRDDREKPNARPCPRSNIGRP